MYACLYRSRYKYSKVKSQTSTYDRLVLVFNEADSEIFVLGITDLNEDWNYFSFPNR